MKLFSLIALAMIPLFGKVTAEDPPNPEAVAERAQKLLEEAYKRQDVMRYCNLNPDSLYPIELDDLQITVRCKAYHDWLILQETARQREEDSN